MRLFSLFSIAFLVAVLSACGGGGGVTNTAPVSAPTAEPQDLRVIPGTTARFERTRLDFGSVPVRGYATRTVRLFNDGSADADFSALDLPEGGFEASGCNDVPAGDSCVLTITFRPPMDGHYGSSDVAPVRADNVTNRLTVVGNAMASCEMRTSGPGLKFAKACP